MRLQLTDPRLLDDLVAYLRAMGCDAHADAADAVAVRVLDARNEQAERSEIAVYVDAWCDRHDGVAVRVLGEAAEP